MQDYIEIENMPEQQNVEYKQSWHDDYLKWVCGFANAIGGVIYIGKDDKGRVVHLNDYAKLMEDIPHKIRNSMGIISDVHLQNKLKKYRWTHHLFEQSSLYLHLSFLRYFRVVHQHIPYFHR